MKCDICIVSKMVAANRKVDFCYREEPETADDSGWRFFSGEEDQQYSDSQENFVLCGLEAVVEVSPELNDLVELPWPIAFERSQLTGELLQIHDYHFGRDLLLC